LCTWNLLRRTFYTHTHTPYYNIIVVVRRAHRSLARQRSPVYPFISSSCRPKSNWTRRDRTAHFRTNSFLSSVSCRSSPADSLQALYRWTHLTAYGVTRDSTTISQFREFLSCKRLFLILPKRDSIPREYCKIYCFIENQN